MHDTSYKLMTTFIQQYVKGGNSVLDVGSCDYNGCYKPLFIGCDYIGLDLEKGPNVDVIASNIYILIHFQIIILILWFLGNV